MKEARTEKTADLIQKYKIGCCLVAIEKSTGVCKMG